MNRTLLDPKAKETLRKGVRGLRARLITDLIDEAKSEYQLDLTADKAKLGESQRRKRERLEATLQELVPGASGKSKTKAQSVDELALRLAATEAAHTLLNRLTFLRILEHHGVLQPALVTGGWESPACAQEFQHYGAAFKEEPSRGYLALLETVYAELALDLPALFGPVGVSSLFPIPVATLRAVLEVLNDPALASAWGDDTTLGWVYQFWNDPERERLDEKIAGGGKIEPHELGPKTQMFTERYMVEWLLHNTLGQTWLAMCRKHGWTPDFDQVRDRLEERRAAFRRQREAGEVPLDALMPLEGDIEERWKYWVPQPLPPEAIQAAPPTLAELKLLDPACGSGHFLVIAFDLLASLYEEEARHRGKTWTRAQVAQWIIERNLFGIDIDPRAIQLSAASLWLKAKLYAPGVQLGRMNLVAPIFRLSSLPKNDPSLQVLCSELERFAVPKQVTLKLVEALSGVDHLGTLLRVDREVASALETQFDELPLEAYRARKQKDSVLDRLADFLDEHATEADLGLRLEGEQVEAGVRFVQMARPDTYDIVIGNPPYQGTSKLAQAAWFKKHYPKGKADLYACFLERGLELAKPGGVSALLTMRGWMFVSQYEGLREHLLATFDLRAIGDFDRGAFDDVPNEVLSVVASIIAKRRQVAGTVAVQPTRYDDTSYDRERTKRKRAAVLSQVGRYEFDVSKLSDIEGMPLIYWWDHAFLAQYLAAPKLKDVAPAREGMSTSDNTRFVIKPWEAPPKGYPQVNGTLPVKAKLGWVPTIMGAKALRWFEPLQDLVDWHSHGLEMKVLQEEKYGSASRRIQSQDLYFVSGVAYSAIGQTFSARLHRYFSIFQSTGSSIFPQDTYTAVCSLNQSRSMSIVAALNPTIHFTPGDVSRLPWFADANAKDVVDCLGLAFAVHEAHREQSVEFERPGSSAWRYAQSWAQLAVDRPEGAPLPPYESVYDDPDPIAYVSFAIGVAVGRFGAKSEGILNEAPVDALPAGILYLSGDESLPDSLKHPAAQRILEAWKEHGLAILQGKRQSLIEWLKKDFFKYHVGLYESRPIYFPIASRDKSFVAFVSIHRWTDTTLQDLLALHLVPALRQLSGEIADLNRERASSDKAKAGAAEKQFSRTKRLHDELAELIAKVTECAERGAPPTDASCPPRKADAKFHMDLDDGVMINSAALWPLVEPLWSKPKQWWKELCQAKGRKDYDWSHLAARYFPARVDEKCRKDPSLGVAHGCFWRYHPAKAYAWELRLQHEIKPDFTIDERDSDASRAQFLDEHPDEAAAIREKEQIRRERAEKKKLQNAGEREDEAAGSDDDATQEDEE
jgi:hypothetical protein